MTTNWAVAAAIALIFSSSIAIANDIRISQVGDDLDMDIVQDGENNSIRGMGGSTSTASMYGDDSKIDFRQTGDTNTISMYFNNDSGGISTPKAIITQTGDRNSVTSDQHGYGHESTISQNGNDNTAWVETGASNSHIGNQFDVSQQGDNLNAYVEQDGSLNSMITDQYCNNACVTSDMRIVVSGNSNSVHSAQGRHFTNSTSALTTDTNEPGALDLDLDITGNSNSVKTSQKNHLTSNPHNMDIDITADSNTLFANQAGQGTKSMTMVVTSDSNSITHTQGGNGAHTSTISLGGTGATTMSVNQGGNNAQTYTLNQTCTNTNGCTVTVNQQ
jgi:hypothetical protein